MISGYSKVLIFGQPFNDYCGGGITLTNLFKGWPKEKIAVAYMGHGLSRITTDVCETYYQLGSEEHKWKFPFNFFQKGFPSGLKQVKQSPDIVSTNRENGLRSKFVNLFFYPFLRWAGLFNSLSSISISQKLKDWLAEFKPDILYLQVSSRETLLFAVQLIDYLQIPAVNHVMDDWPSTLYSGLFRKYWYRKIDKEIKQYNDKIQLHLSISEAMSDEYLKRYNKRYIPFHNPVDSGIWMKHAKKVYDIDKHNVTLLYSGRIGIGITGSLIDIATAIDSISKADLNIKFTIQTFTQDPVILNKLKEHSCVVINPFAAYEDLPLIFSEADILILANDFTKEGLRLLKYSMPTKVSEYMISGTPILLYAPEETAISKFFLQNKCGFCVTERNTAKVTDALNTLIYNQDYRKMISNAAVKLAHDKFDKEKVRKEFQRLLNETKQN